MVFQPSTLEGSLALSTKNIMDQHPFILFRNIFWKTLVLEDIYNHIDRITFVLTIHKVINPDIHGW